MNKLNHDYHQEDWNVYCRLVVQSSQDVLGRDRPLGLELLSAIDKICWG